jgi:hypothetical protein
VPTIDASDRPRGRESFPRVLSGEPDEKDRNLYGDHARPIRVKGRHEKQKQNLNKDLLERVDT